VKLDKSHQYVFRVGSDNQHRIFWDGSAWHYEFLAGSVVFDEQSAASEQELADILAAHGMKLDRFSVDESRSAEQYSARIQEKIVRLTAAGIRPCSKHGLTAKNDDGVCQACADTDYFDDFKGTEG
jgi:hypothetical protein